MAEFHSTLYDILWLLLAAVVAVPVLQRFGVPSVLGYLAAGAALGPYTPGVVIDVESTLPLAEFGVVFLLFAIGLELPLSRLRTMRRYIFGLGALQVLVTATVLGGLAFALGLSPKAAVLVGVTLAFSSTATVLAILVERNEAVTQTGRVSIAVLIFQDLAVVPVLALLPLLAGTGHDIGTALGLALAKACVAMALIFVLGRYVVRPLYGFIAARRTSEVFTAANLLLVLTVAWVTEMAGMSMALGAFLAGLLLADSPYRHQVEADIDPFRGLLLGLFFMTVGMSVDLPFVAQNLLLVLAVTLGLLAVKALVLTGLARLLRVDWATVLRVGLLLAQGGEFAFVVFGKAGALGVLDHTTTQTLTATVALSMILTPLLSSTGRRWSKKLKRRMGLDLVPTGTEEVQQHVIIAGYGRVGRTIAGLLQEHGVPYVALDLDAERVAQARAEGLPVFYGDVSQAGVLRSIGIDRARAVIVTVNNARGAERAVGAVHDHAPGLPIIARAHDLRQQGVLRTAGAAQVVPEAIEVSFQMAGLALRSMGIADDIIERCLAGHRSSGYGTLESGNDGAGHR
ncbi:monovalent cation:proton antiporter-2 (CPA2) family protein [Novispirillum itersonii]|uniref:CPA2 family monovalent cation:H+ antiporter-2 n=1 Tax=Novispirillum itersonii TaxID=189 RepID=A0A7W9ZGU0_NOVIT|nr:monovalent cation:proton antiporter-2 (CPA2) family protein [Novispirillum itersonii]MBB6211236.1 CPA2 family monovalent cation:H+ antiporter-2 [Novispirillum itersonii]